MDELHTVKENCRKVESVLIAIEMLYQNRDSMSLEMYMHRMESLHELAREARESMESIRYKAL